MVNTGVSMEAKNTVEKLIKMEDSARDFDFVSFT